MATTYLHAIETTVPEVACPQERMLRFMKAIPSYSEEQREVLERIYRASAIEMRHTVVEDFLREVGEGDFFLRAGAQHPEPTLKERNELFARESRRLATAVTAKLMRVHGIAPASITHLVTVSCTGFSAPGFDFHLVGDLGLSRDLHRFHIGFMGCFGAFPALKLAHSVCSSEPKARVLIVSVELCSLHFQLRPETDFLVSNSLFSDGCAAALVSSRREDSPGARFVIDGFASRIIPDSESAMAWTIGEHAFDMRLSAYIPSLLETNITPLLDSLLASAGLGREDIRHWAIHPGGRKILDKLRGAIGLGSAALEDSYGVLRDFGNMSSATVLFVLRRILEHREPGRCFAAAFGPGLTAETALLTQEAA